MDKNKKHLELGIGALAVAIIGFVIYKKTANKTGKKLSADGGRKMKFRFKNFNAQGDGDIPVSYQLLTSTTFNPGEPITDSYGNTATIDGDDACCNMLLVPTSVVLQPNQQSLSGTITGQQSGASANITTFNGLSPQQGAAPSTSYSPAEYQPVSFNPTYAQGAPSYYNPSTGAYEPTPYSEGVPPSYYNPNTGTYQSTPVSTVPTYNTPTPQVSTPTIDMTGTWNATDANGNQIVPPYNPVCSSTMLSFGGNNTLNVPYETTASDTITFINNQSIVAGQPNGAVIGTVYGVNPDGTTSIGASVTWNDIHHGTWTRTA